MLTINHKRLLTASILGSVLEAYDFMIYMFFAHYISKLFFQNASSFVSTLETFMVFAAGYLSRPIGGLLLSHFGDRYGRKITFLTATIVMTLSIFFIGLLPTQSSIGALASLFLVLLRVLQGLSFGGEIPGSITFISEHIPKSRQVFANALLFLGINFGLMLASFVGTVIHEFFTDEQILNFAWRIPFLFGGVLGVASFYFRRMLTETDEFLKLKELKKIEKIPIVALFKDGYFLQIIYGISLVSLGAATVFFYLFTPSYASHQTGLSESKILVVNTISTFILSFTIAIAGYFADKWKPRRIYLIGSIFLLLFSYLLYQWIMSGSFEKLAVSFFIFSIFSGFISGTYPGILPILFPTSVRYTGISFVYNIAYGLVGGLSPVLCTLLVHYSHNISAPGLYISLISLFPILMMLLTWLLRRQLHAISDL